jgi:uncharacterized protein YacL
MRTAGPKSVHSSQLSKSAGHSVRASSSAIFWVIRALLLVGTGALCYALQPFGLHPVPGGVLGLAFAALILVVEMRVRHGAVGSVLGGAVGTVAGISAALLTSLLISRTSEAEATKSCLEFLSLFAFAYLGLMLGSSLGADFWWRRETEDQASPEARDGESLKLLDTSVLIDGRIADICEAHFLDGALCVPQFILHELQMVADSSDPLKRQRGRRGLEILQRMQKMERIDVRILDDAGAQGSNVDDKLVEVARRIGAKIVTNDFNLNKVATVHGIAVLNVNLLANAMKPAVLPGEPMRVLIVREGKEPNQGVAYLDDGTMVVVDGARKMISKSVDVVVTSVHQTTAGKMIFGRIDERGGQNASDVKQVAATAGIARSDAPLRGAEGPSSGRQTGS